MRVFWDLLPFRVKQAVAGRAFDRFWIRRQRRRSQQKAVHSQEHTRRLLVDLAVISKDDAGTGIQRVVRALALALADDRFSGWDVQFVAANRHSPYHGIAWPYHESAVDCSEIEARPGDVFVGLDFSLDAVRRYGRQLMQFRRDGGTLWFLVHDLLPLEYPEWFSRNTVLRYKAWLDIIAGIADGFFCNSEQTEQQLRCTLNARYGLSQGYKTKVLPMGYNILQTIVDPSVIVDVGVRFDLAHPFFLMVGTLEPRKGHELVIAAFEELWADGAVQPLILVGRMGWHVENLRDYIVGHAEFGKRLLWFDDVEDVELEKIYQACEGVIIASYAEGFGLPLIEALGHQKPVLARDIPVFRSHEESGVYFFPQNASSHDLRRCIESWAGEIEAGLIKIRPPEACWADSAQHLLRGIV
ncbi:glycosyl transferase [Sphingobium baderi]|uniref:Glycosyl transferase n=1 Tax=Sphingobium baderi TaxID=1332080 RepID=A0A0S3F567_9SPHN|nr:glycosyl transferase [Sphingobium baderi]